jgi:hypothetical protein
MVIIDPSPHRKAIAKLARNYRKIRPFSLLNYCLFNELTMLQIYFAKYSQPKWEKSEILPGKIPSIDNNNYQYQLVNLYQKFSEKLLQASFPNSAFKTGAPSPTPRAGNRVLATNNPKLGTPKAPKNNREISAKLPKISPLSLLEYCLFNGLTMLQIYFAKNSRPKWEKGGKLPEKIPASAANIVQFHSVIFFQKIAEKCSQSLHPGYSLCARRRLLNPDDWKPCSGNQQLKTRNWKPATFYVCS